MDREISNRVEFERWYSDNYFLTGGDFIKKHNQYVSGVIEMMWRAWQAARQTLKVNLPAPAELEVVRVTCYTGEEFRTNEDVYYVEDIHLMLDESGVNYE